MKYVIDFNPRPGYGFHVDNQSGHAWSESWNCFDESRWAPVKWWPDIFDLIQFAMSRNWWPLYLRTWPEGPGRGDPVDLELVKHCPP